MSEVLMNWGIINDQDPTLAVSPSGGKVSKFGLNTGFVSKLIFNENGGKDGAPMECIDMEFEIGAFPIRKRIFNVTSVYDAQGRMLADKTNPEFIKKYNTEIKHIMALVVQTMKALNVSQEVMDRLFQGRTVNSFAEWGKMITSLLNSNYPKIPVDVFLHYEWKPRGENDKTYLEFPKTLRNGTVICGHIEPVGEWKEEREWTLNGIKLNGLRYVDDAGKIHPFQRDEYYMGTNNAKQSFKAGPKAASIIPAAINSAAIPSAGTTSEWGASNVKTAASEWDVKAPKAGDLPF